jgi:hypothetical protein
VVLATVCLPLLAAMAVAHWERTGRIATETDPGETRCARSLMLVGGIVLAAIGGVIVFAWLRPAFRVEKHTVLINGLVRAAFLAVIFILTMAMAGKWRRSAGATPWESPGWKLSRSVTLVLLVLLDLITHAPSQNPTVAPKALLAGAWAEAGQPAPKRDEGRA